MLLFESIQALQLAVFHAEDVTIKYLNPAASLFDLLDQRLFYIMRGTLAGISDGFSHGGFQGSHL